MSLDIWLTMPQKETGIYIHENGQKRELSTTELKEKFPGFQPSIETVFETNITHNLGEMAEKAGVYNTCWRPEAIGATHAAEIVDILETGYKALKNNREYFKQYDSPNGWGTYDDFLPWLREYLEACKKHPAALINVDR